MSIGLTAPRSKIRQTKSYVGIPTTYAKQNPGKQYAQEQT